ncbi:TPA: hypothetical protein KL544_003139 [Escherichia coli]|nr:hypothetical protein [Escherichia coli]
MQSEIEQYYAGLPARRLKEMHENARRAYENDKNLSQQEKEDALYFGSPLAYYGTDKEKDWPEHVDAIEKALSDMSEAFTPIDK